MKKGILAVMLGMIVSVVSAAEVTNKTSSAPVKDVTQADQEAWRDKVEIMGWKWKRGGFNTVMLGDFIITNGTPWHIKDITVRTYSDSASGTMIDKNVQVIYETIPPFSARLFSEVNMGFLHSQAQASRAMVSIFEYDDSLPPVSLEAREKVFAAQRLARQQALDAAKQREKNKKDEMAAKTLKHHQELAEKGDPYGLFQMGRRYTTADGVAKDEKIGRQYLEKAAALGSLEAKSALKKHFPEPVEIKLK